MRVARFMLFSFFVLIAVLPGRVQTAGSGLPSYQRFLSPASPLEIVSARKVDRLAWIAFEEGRRNVDTASAPRLRPCA
jgi:dipeptidyl-peptidase 4